MANPNPKQENLVPFKAGHDPRREGNGRPKGAKSIATLIRELEEEEFDWNQLPTKDVAKIKEAFDDIVKIGSPLRAVVFRAYLDAVTGRGLEKVAAREWLRKAGYGDKLDVTSLGKEIARPLIMPEVKKRYVETEEETNDGSGSD